MPESAVFESHDEQIKRVERMASDDLAWSLSRFDLIALNTVLKERAELLKWLKWYADNPQGHPDARIAIGEAEGKRMRIELPIKEIRG